MNRTSSKIKTLGQKLSLNQPRLLFQDRFSKWAPSLRKELEARWLSSGANGERFIWDYWYSSHGYCHLRTPSHLAFSQEVLEGFLEELLVWGDQNLGCPSTTPLWVSNYVEGCHQGLHVDQPHGPWAFVLSLAPKQRSFTGGETLIAKPSLTHYNGTLAPSSNALDSHQDRFFERVAPDFNRLTIFDGRIPHGVTPVRGVLNPMEGRTVLHGWFSPPRTRLEGEFSETLVRNRIQEIENLLDALLSSAADQGASFQGSLCLESWIEDQTGKATATWLYDQTQSTDNPSLLFAKSPVGKRILDLLGKAYVLKPSRRSKKPKKGPASWSRLVLPLSLSS